MEIQLVDIQVLTDLGLTTTEARVFISLHTLETANAREISKFSKVTRPDVYRALSELHNLGLVEKVVANPASFRASPIETGIAIMLKQKAMKYRELESKSACLIEKINAKKFHKISDPNPQFILIPSKQAIINKLKKSIDKTQKTIDILTSCKRLKFACYCLLEELDKAWQRGVAGRAIVEEQEEPPFDFGKTCWSGPYAKIKYTDAFPKTVMAIYDQCEVFIFVESKADLTESSAIWSDNPSLVSLAKDHFNLLWNEAHEKTE